MSDLEGDYLPPSVWLDVLFFTEQYTNANL